MELDETRSAHRHNVPAWSAVWAFHTGHILQLEAAASAKDAGFRLSLWYEGWMRWGDYG